MSDDNDIVEVYTFQGHEGETVPEDAERLNFKPGIRVVPDDLCRYCKHLREVNLPKGLQKIGERAFFRCGNLLEINEIPRTVQVIGERAFFGCLALKKVEFEDDGNSPHQLLTIGDSAFLGCRSLERFQPPTSVTSVCACAFNGCTGLIEADLSKTSITQVASNTFGGCSSLQTVSLPSTVDRICYLAFSICRNLVTVVLPLNSAPITIEVSAFFHCSSLANLVLPPGSSAHEDAFDGCTQFSLRWVPEDADDAAQILHCLERRFEDSPVSWQCYEHPKPNPEQVRQCIRQCQEKWGENVKNPFEDEFGMNPFHVLFSTPDPNVELLEVLLGLLPNQMLQCKDCNDKRPLDYLMNNWTVGTFTLLQKTLKSWMMDRLARWGAMKWAQDMKMKAGELMLEDDKEQRVILFSKVYSAYEKYQRWNPRQYWSLSCGKGKSDPQGELIVPNGRL